MAGCIQPRSKTKKKTLLSFQHNAQALSAENTGAEGVGEYGRTARKERLPAAALSMTTFSIHAKCTRMEQLYREPGG